MKSRIRISRGIESLFGTRDENIRLLESELQVRTRLLDGDSLELEGDDPQVQRAERILEDYVDLVTEGHSFNNGDLNSFMRVLVRDPNISLRRLVESGKSRAFGKKVLAPKTVNQRRYVDAIENHDLTFGIGPAGTGKTYLAVAMAVSAYLNKASKPHCVNPSRGRSRRASRLSSRHAAGKSRSLFAAPIRRAVRHDRLGESRKAVGEETSSKSLRSLSCAVGR